MHILRRAWRLALIVCAVVVVAAAAYVVHHHDRVPDAGQIPSPPKIRTRAASSLPVRAPEAIKHAKLLVIMEENYSCPGSQAGMPYLTRLGSRPGGAHVDCGNWVSLGHLGVGLYIDLAHGSDHGIQRGAPSPSNSFTGPSVFDQAIQAGRTAKIYEESMPHNCDRNNAQPYITRHNPWLYGYDPTVQADCRRFDVPLGTTTAGALSHDIRTGALPTNALVVPNLEHDARTGSIAEADAWLHSWIPLLEGGPDYQSGRLTVVITWDQPHFHQPGTNPVQTVILHKGLTGQAVASGTYNLFSITRWYEDVAGTPYLGNARTAGDLRTVLRL